MSDKTTKIRIKPIQTIPTEADVCHFDELDDETMHYLAEFVSGRTESEQQINDQSAVEVLKNCTSDIVKFTDFYRIESF